MDLKLIRNLVRLMERGEVTELEIDDQNAGMRVHLKRGGNADAATPVAAPVVMMGGAPAGGPPVNWGAVPQAGPAAASDAPAERDPSIHEITSPMVGTYYRAVSPESDPFSEVGQRVDEQTTICIIEAMKVMNEIKAECRGEIVEILVENGDPVEFGQPIFLVKKG
ncbi:MAG: acetyl-CoA carboxylase biotin carboxyl carrier protein [Planctomycetota bacterium]|jgi:acetyl-CoA carboxylase biotin carboxyl carrier protein